MAAATTTGFADAEFRTVTSADWTYGCLYDYETGAYLWNTASTALYSCPSGPDPYGGPDACVCKCASAPSSATGSATGRRALSEEEEVYCHKPEWGSSPRYGVYGWSRMAGGSQGGYAYHPGAAQPCEAGFFWDIYPAGACEYQACPDGYDLHHLEGVQPSDWDAYQWVPVGADGRSPVGTYYPADCPCRLASLAAPPPPDPPLPWFNTCARLPRRRRRRPPSLTARRPPSGPSPRLITSARRPPPPPTLALTPPPRGAPSATTARRGSTSPSTTAIASGCSSTARRRATRARRRAARRPGA